MKRITVLVVLLTIASLSVAAAGSFQQPAAPAPRVVEVEKLKDNLYVLRGMGGGGNTAVFITANGVVVVDTKNPGWGQPIIDKIKELTPKPITTIINTHTHGDHVSGNVEFPASVDVVVHENTRTNMQKMLAPSGFPPANPPTIFEANKGRGMPKRTFKDRLSLGNGNDRIDLYYFGRGHTNGDAWVVFTALRTMHAGDIFSGKNIPLLDGINGGSGVQIADTLLKAHDTVKNVDTIISGHSVQMTMADLKEYSEFNREFLMAVQQGKKAGKSIDDIASSWKMPAKYKGYAEPAAARLRSNVQVTYDELK
jgi:glyoxylase-like metal-dependent hydrolase (beta-lactamase superfamily II)